MPLLQMQQFEYSLFPMSLGVLVLLSFLGVALLFVKSLTKAPPVPPSLTVTLMAPLNPSAPLYIPASTVAQLPLSPTIHYLPYLPPILYSFGPALLQNTIVYRLSPFCPLPPFCFTFCTKPQVDGWKEPCVGIPPICSSSEVEAAAPLPQLIEIEAGEKVESMRPTDQPKRKKPRGWRGRFNKTRRPRLAQRYRVIRDPDRLPLPHELNDGKKTTVMVRNLPSKMTKEQLLELLDEHCRDENQKLPAGTDSSYSEFDLMYLPIDFKSGNNLGYAFVNFTNSSGALRLHGYLQGKDWPTFRSRKVCEVTYARIQGLESLMDHFKKMPSFPSKDYLPLRFIPSRNGFGSTLEEYIGSFEEPARKLVLDRSMN